MVSTSQGHVKHLFLGQNTPHPHPYHYKNLAINFLLLYACFMQLKCCSLNFAPSLVLLKFHNFDACLDWNRGTGLV